MVSDFLNSYYKGSIKFIKDLKMIMKDLAKKIHNQNDLLEGGFQMETYSPEIIKYIEHEQR